MQRYPELYYAYIGNGQMINTTQNDVMGYELTLDYLADKGNTPVLEALRHNGPPPYRGKDMAGKYVAYLDVLNEYIGTSKNCNHGIIVACNPIAVQTR